MIDCCKHSKNIINVLEVIKKYLLYQENIVRVIVKMRKVLV